MKNFAKYIFILALSPLMAFAKSVPQDLRSYPDRLVRVSSILYDYGLKRNRKIEGVGSIVFSRKDFKSRYFVLTAGHVSSGDQLTVETGRKRKIQIKSVYHKTQYDLTLIELEPKAAASIVPLAEYKSGELETLFTTYVPVGKRLLDGSVDISEFATTYFLMTDAGTSPFPAEIADGFAVSANGMFGMMPQAPWLAAGKSFIPRENTEDWMMNKAYSEGTVDETLQLDQNRQFLRTGAVFEHGRSGSPILIPYPKGIFGHSQFMLSGVLTAANDKMGATIIPGPKAINDFMAAVVEGNGKVSSEKPVWFLINGKFVSVTDKLEAYVISNRIGNGVVIDGYVVDRDAIKERLDKDLREKGISETDVNDLQRKIELVNKTLSSPNGENKARELLKRMNSSRSTVY